MQKLVQKMLLLAAMLLVPWVTQAQGVQGCTFSTGVDTTAWITLSSSATHITAIEGEDDEASSCINIGFDFYFGGFTYTQFSCNSNGRFRLGPTACSNYWTQPFMTLTDPDNNDLPFITAFGMDNTLEATGSYVKYELVGTAPNRILVVEYLTPSEYNDMGDLVNYQIQLMEDSNRVRLVYGSNNATYFDSYQIGVAGSATDILMVNASTHTTFTTGTSTTFDSWPGTGRYYQFTMGYPPACPSITSIVAEQVTAGSAMLSWSIGSGSPESYAIEYYPLGSTTAPTTLTSTTPSVAITGLDTNTSYVVRVRAYCGTDGYGNWDSITITTMGLGCAYYDPNTSHVFTSGTGTTQTTGVPVNSSWGNTMCQSIYMASELIAAGFDTNGAGITDLAFTWTNNSSYAKYFTIYLTNTTATGFASASSSYWVPTGAAAKVYEGPHPLNTSGTVTYHLDTPFAWDGHSNLCVTTTMNQPSGASHSISSFYGYSTQSSTSEYRTMYKYQDSSPLDGSNPSSITPSSRSYYRPNITFTSRECAGLATCAEPAVTIDSVSATSVSLSWLPGYQETSWEVEYCVQGTNSWTSAGTVSTLYTTVTGLNPATYYDLRVLNICGTDTFSTMVTTPTDCIPIAHSALPFTYGFEDLSSTSSGSPLSLCWNRGYWSGSYNANSYPYASTTYHTGSRSLYFYGYGTTTRSWVCLPEFEDSINTLRLRFWAKKSSTSYSGLMKVGVMTDPTDWNTFQPVTTEQTNSTTDWQQFEVSLGHAPAAGYITIAVVSDNSLSNYMYVDDIIVDEMPFCIMPVIDSVVSTTTTADIYLSDIDNAVGFTMQISHGGTSTTVLGNSSPISITDLNPGTEYTYSLVANCGTENSNARTGSFRTECTPIASSDLPFSYGFEDIVTTGSGIPLAPCWSRGYLSGSSFNAMNYPYASTSYAHSGSKSLYYYGYSTSTRSWLCLPEFEDSINTLQLKFWAKKSSDSYSGVIKIGVMTDPADYSTFQLVNTVTATNGTEWNRFDMPLTGAPGTGFITILVDGGGTSSNYIYLDDIEVEDIPECPHVWNLRVDSVYVDWASISWSEMGTASAWVVEYDTVDFVPGTYTAANSDMVYDTTLLLTGLDTGYTYYFYVRADCGGDTSTYESLVFTTLAGLPATVPYMCTFEGRGTNGWDLLNGTQTNQWYVGNATNNGGSKCLYISDNGGVSNTYTNSSISYVYAIRSFNFEDTGEYVYGYDWKCQGESHNYDFARMFITPVSYQWTAGVNPAGSTYSFASWSMPSGWYELTENFSSPRTMSQSSTWRSVTGSFHLTTPGTYNLVIAWANDGSGGSQPPFAIDNIQLARNTCPMPTNVTATSVSSDQVTITWTAGGNENMWVVVNGLTEDNTYTNSYTFTSLQPNTNYTFGVRAVCGGDDSSMAATVNVLTDCGGLSALPFAEDFETQSSTSSTTANSTFIRCWHHLNNATSYMGYPYIANSTTYNHTPGGTMGLYWYGSTTSGTYGDYYYIVLPAVDTDIIMMNTLRLKFWAKVSSTGYHPVFNVGVMTDPTDVNTFQTVNTININPGSSTAWAQFVTSFSDFTGAGSYIAIRALRPSSSWYTYMDDITLDLIPDCPEVSNILVSSITTTSASLDWTENGNADAWTIEYGVHGFTLGSGITENVSALPYTLSGLLPNTEYDVYITPACTGTAVSESVTFRTECEPTSTIPITMGFESSEGVNTGSSTSYDFINCWHRLNNGSSYYGYPYVANSSTYNHTPGGSRGLYWYNTTTTGTYGDYQIVVLPPIDVDAYSLSNLQLKFWAKASSSSYNPTFQVGVMTDPNNAATFQQLGMVDVGNSTQWDEYTVGLAGYTGSGNYVALRATRPGSSWYAYVDDITLELAPLCPAVSHPSISNVGTTSALLSWNLQAGARQEYIEEFEIEVYDNVTNTVVVSTTDTNRYFFITGLQPLSSYTAKVRAACGTDGNGSWDSVSFSTPCPLGGNVPITGTGVSTTTYYLPLNNYYNYSYTQQIILANELNGPTTIHGIRFNYNYATAVSNKSNCTIYVGHTTLSSLTTSNFVDPSTLTPVYTGAMNVHNGWNEFTFTTPFVYDGSQNLVIAVDDNSGVYPGSSYVYNAYNCSGTLGMHFYSDSQNPDPTSTSTLTGFSGSKSTVSYRVAMELVMPCDSNPNCVPPNVVVTEVGSNDITAYWGAGLNETSWLVEYRPADSNGWNIIGLESDNNYTFSGLTPNTDYQIRVTTMCSDTDMATIVNVRTACAPTAIPFHENFASFATGSASPFPSCWTKNSNYSTGYPYVSTSYSISGGRSVYMYSGSTSYSYFTLPLFDAPIDTLQVSFWLYRTTTSNTQEIHVGVMTDPTDVSTFELVDVAYPQQLSTWEPFEIPLTSYHGTGQYIALMSPNGVNSYPYLDEVNVEYVSPCPRVRNVTTSNIGFTSARVSWDTTAADSYELEYGPAGFAFGTGTTITGITGDSITLTGLAPSSHYDVYVRGLCSPDTSNWSFAHSFYTLCALIDSVPFFEDFNHIGTSTSIHSPHCWYGYSTYSTSYPYPSASYNRSGASGAAMYMYHSNSSGYYTMLQLPQVDTTVLPINNLQVEFSMLMTTTSYTHGVIVGVCTGQGMTDFTPVDTLMITAGTYEWQDFEVLFNNYTGHGSYITFVAYSAGSTYCYPYLDDINLDVIPTCLRPDSLYATNATSSTVQLGWRERGSATSWEVEYGPTGFTPGSGTRVITYANPTTLTGLPASFQGDFYVRSICDAGDTSRFNREAVGFSTSQMPASIPYYCNFEDSTEWSAWQTSSNTYINWARGTAEVDSGTYSIYISPDGGLTFGNEDYSSIVNAAVFRDVDFGTVDTSFTISFRAKVGGTTTARYDGMMVFLVDQSIPAVPSSSAITSPWGNVNDLYRIAVVYLDTTWNTYTASFDTISGVKRVAFFWFNQNTGASYAHLPIPAAVDNIRINYSPCPRPVNLDTVALSSSTATLHWDGPASANYLVAYRVYGAPASTNVYIPTNTNSITLTGLDPITTYRAWVQKICGTDSSLFSDGVNFTTYMCDDPAIAAVGSENSTGTSYLAPVNNFYNYTLTETIIDSAELGGPMDIGYLAYYYNYTSATTSKNNCTVYFQPTTLSSFGSASDVVALNPATAVKVYTGNLNCTEGWNFFPLDTIYQYDGHTNLMVIVDDNSGSYNGSAYVFKTEPCTTNKVLYYYSDSYDPDVTTISSSYSGSKAVASWRPVMQLISCGSIPVCHEPIITSITKDYHSATITWMGDGNAYEVNIKESTATNWPATDIVVTGNSYTFNGLTPSTHYTFRVRQDCTADTIGYSNWVIDGFLTDSLPCLAPDSLHTTAVTNSTATFDWNVNGNENVWDIHVWYGTFDSTYRTILRPATVGGFTAGLTYNAAIRALCGVDMLEGDWSDTVQFTTAVCPDVTGLTTSNVTTSNVTLSWNNNPMAQSWNIEYGPTGFTQGQGTQATSNTNSYVVTGLSDGLTYDFYVKAVCGDNWTSENWVGTSATTQEGTIPCDAPSGVNTAVADNSVTVNWTAETGNISFEIEYGVHGFSHGMGTTVTATSSPAVISNLDYETQYDLYVRALCEQNTTSPWSTMATFTTDQRPSEDCDPVQNLTVTDVTETSASVSWQAGATGDSWQVVLTDANGATVSDNVTSETHAELTGLSPRTNYTVKVRTVCGDDNYSAYVTANFRTEGEGIDDVEGVSCRIYPNPTSNSTTVSITGVNGKVRIAVVDMNGRTVATETLECSADCEKTMEVDKLAQGAYFVRITADDVNMVKKLIVR